jgi:hypothetical protein
MQCENCHTDFALGCKRRGAPRRFCSDRCRLAAYKLRAPQNEGGADRKLHITQRKEREATMKRSNATGETVADDLLRGAKEIALFVYGDEEAARRIYVYKGEPSLPLFYMGRMLCSRKSSLRKWMDELEVAAARAEREKEAGGDEA